MTNSGFYDIIGLWIDDFYTCLKDNQTGYLVETEVSHIKNKRMLKGYNAKTGWFVNWQKLFEEGKNIFQLKVKGKEDIQGLGAYTIVEKEKTVYIDWLVANPKSQPQKTKTPEYSGIGGHLFAVAIDISKRLGFEGNVFGEATGIKLLRHYMLKLGAKRLGSSYRYWIDPKAAEKIIDSYQYEWREEEYENE